MRLCVCAFVRLCVRSFVRSFLSISKIPFFSQVVGSFVGSFVRSFVRSFVCLHFKKIPHKKIHFFGHERPREIIKCDFLHARAVATFLDTSVRGEK